MRISDRRKIDRQVRLFIQSMPKGYEKCVPKDVVISEILGANAWLVQIPTTMEQIREEVEKQFDIYVS